MMGANNLAEGEELMVAAINNRLRVEQPFTTDRSQVLAALARMKHDPSLWQEPPAPDTRIGYTPSHPHQFGFYDACVVGRGDKAIFAAAVGRAQDIVDYQRMNPEMANHFLAWAEKFSAHVHGRVGFLRGAIRHLWHGDVRNRQYTARHDILREAGFDPRRDLRIDDDGCWRWSSDRPRMHASVHGYLSSRREDG